MTVSAVTVKVLRERTGAGMMECKKALEQSGGDIEKAIDGMRKSGMAKAAKRAGRVATEGLVVIKQNEMADCMVLAEVNSETDFVAKDETFKGFCDEVANCILTQQPTDMDTLMGTIIGDGEQTIETSRQQLVTRIGENVSLRRFFILVASSGDNVLGSYLHGTRIGVLVELEGGDAPLAKDIAMHIAASNPLCIAEQDISADILAKEREIFLAQAEESGKPAGIIEKMVDGRVKKFLKEVTLLGQPFVKCPDQTIAELLKSSVAQVRRYVRYEVGEGLERQDGDFAAEVMAQARGSR